MRLAFAFLFVLCCSLPVETLQAAPPAESLLPSTTKAFISVPDVDVLLEHWDATDLGKLADDPLMKPFVDDLKRQLREKFSATGKELGLTWEELRGVHGGEVAAALIQPKGDRAAHAFAIVCDVTGHDAEAQALLAKVSTNLQREGARLTTQQAGGVAISVFTLPKKEKRPAGRQAVLALAHNTLVASDNVQEVVDLLARLQGPSSNSLQQAPAFQITHERVAREAGDVQPHVRWFIEPFGLGDVMRAADTEQKRRGVDYLKIFREEGFDSVQGIGGYVQLKTAEYEFLHHTFVYAGVPAGSQQLVNAANFRESARMLDFPNASLARPTWLPRELANTLTFNWKVKESFEYSKTLINAVADDPIFDDVIEGFRNDLQIDVRKDVIAHLGNQITFATDYRLPITPDSERVMVSFELTNPEAMAAALNKAMARDPDVRKIPYGPYVIWEILDPTDTTPTTTITLKIDGPEFGPLDGVLQEEEPEEKPAFPNSAITVAYGRLIWVSQVDYAKDLLAERPETESLVACADYQAVNAALEKLGAGQDSFRYFARADEALRPTYELMRQGKMPEAKTLLGRALNRIFVDEDDKLLRKQEIDAQKLPDYQIVRRHLGPSGIYARTEQNGWLVVGCGLSKRAE